ncbi:MAG TPA: tetratricopeptide repeat protein [Burkholderiales bacterium]
MLKRLLKHLLGRSPAGAGDSAAAPAGAAALDQALACYQRREFDSAEELCRALLRGDPEHAAAHALLGALALVQGETAAAIASLERAVALEPGSYEYRCNCGEAYRRAGRLARAVACFHSALGIKHDDPAAWHNLALAQQALGNMREAILAFRKALALQGGDAGFHSGLLFTLGWCPGIDGEEILAEHRRWGALYADHLTDQAAPHENLADPDKVLRIGYFTAEPTPCFVEPFIAHRDRRRFQVIFYKNNAYMDEDVLRLRQMADGWRQVESMSDAEVAELIRRDGIDILVDMAGHTNGNRLLTFARKPAPVQVSYLGYLNTSGMKSIDYRITDSHADPPGVAERYHSERLIRLPHSLWCYRPPAAMPAPGPLPALTRGHVTFGSFNHFSKVNGQVRQLWAQLLQAMPNSRLLALGVPAGENRETMREAFVAQGVAADRIEIHGRLDYAQYLRMYQETDIALDSFPYNGGTTTCDALWMGVPVVALAGQYGAARSGVSLLSVLGLGHLIAATPERYVAIAQQLAANPGQLSTLRATMRERMRNSPLMDAPGFSRALETAYREMWRTWCREKSAAAKPGGSGPA